MEVACLSRGFHDECVGPRRTAQFHRGERRCNRKTSLGAHCRRVLSPVTKIGEWLTIRESDTELQAREHTFDEGEAAPLDKKVGTNCERVIKPLIGPGKGGPFFEESEEIVLVIKQMLHHREE
jgi:hypothetical protein